MNNLEKQNPKGFTLVEVLVSILIFSFVITMLFFSFRTFIVSGKHVKESLAQNQDINSFFKRVSMDLEAVRLPQPPVYHKPEFNSDPDPYRFEGTRENMGGALMASSMSFTSLSHVQLIPGDREGLAKIRYYLRPNTAQGFDICRSDALMPVSGDHQSCSDPVLYKDVTAFEIVYINLDGEEYEYWDSESDTFQYMFPASVRFKIQTGSGENEKTFETTFRLIPFRRPID